ncbi:hypothetical protein, partial [Kitasatospora albolonga]|uniref:hypothetical protein n=1 Tax=Kitasatospora albolonga TaxID=68173 RepID=UPI0031E4E984
MVYLVSAWLILGGRYWARGVVMGVALVEGYNRLRSLTGALLDAPQTRVVHGTVEGWLKLSDLRGGPPGPRPVWWSCWAARSSSPTSAAGRGTDG